MRAAPFAPASFAIEQDNATGSLSYWQMGDHQSHADRNGVSLAEYIHAIYGLLRQSKAQHVLMIGCGGGTLASMLHKVGVRVTIVDVDPTAFAVARQYFRMPDVFECHIRDGRSFLRAETRKFDAIVLDAYAGEKIPRHLLQPSFFALVRARLKARKSLFLINLIVPDEDDRAADKIGGALRQVWRQVKLLDAPGRGCRNAIAVAGSLRDLKRPRLLQKPKARAKTIAGFLADMEFRALPASD